MYTVSTLRFEYHAPVNGTQDDFFVSCLGFAVPQSFDSRRARSNGIEMEIWWTTPCDPSDEIFRRPSGVLFSKSLRYRWCSLILSIAFHNGTILDGICPVLPLVGCRRQHNLPLDTHQLSGAKQRQGFQISFRWLFCEHFSGVSK